MAFDPDLLELMPLVCELRPLASRNKFGEEAYGSSAVYPHCHVQETGRQIYSGGTFVGTEEGVVYLDGVYPVTVTWTLFIPQPGADNREVKIISVDQNADEEGFHHTAVHFGAL